MLKTKSKILLILLSVVLLVSSCCFATTEPETTADNNETAPVEDEAGDEVQTDDVISDDLFIAEDIVNISGVVDGNAFVIGNEVTISGEILGNLFVVANKLVMDDGYVYNSLFACAKEIIINGVYTYDMYAVCDNFQFMSSAITYRDLRVLASNVSIEGQIGRNAYISANTLSFANSVSTNVYGELYYSAPNEIVISENAVAGEIHYTATNTNEDSKPSDIVLEYVTDLLQTLVFTFIAVLVLLWLTPKFVNRIGNSSVAKSFACLGIGVVAPIALIFVAILLALSTIGSSILVFGIFAVIALFYISFSIVSIFFGKIFAKLCKTEGNFKFVLLTLASSIVLWVICQIPVIGRFFSVLISLFGVGITLVNMVWKKEKVEKVEEVKTEEN